jgi:hypothetical protein
MNLYLLENQRFFGAYSDEFDSCVVAAGSEAEARLIHPGSHELRSVGSDLPLWDSDRQQWSKDADEWDVPSALVVKFLGQAAPDIKSGVILSSFNCGT